MIAKAFDATFPAAAALVVGLAFGAVYFAALRRSVGHPGARGRAVRIAAAAAGRIVTAAAFFTSAARFGAPPLLASMIGFLIARTLRVRAARMAERLEASRP
jgi:hypothetical protein